MKVCMVEDDPEITEVVTIAFETAWPGSEFVGACNAVEGLKMLKKQNPDVVIMDVRLPEGDASGFELCKVFRSFSNTPVIMISARDRDVDIVRGLESGATDYLTKPFSTMELLARTKAMLRREWAGPSYTHTQPFVAEDLSVDSESRQVLLQGEPVHLTPIEYRLLRSLVRNTDRVVTNEAIVEEVWGSSYRNSKGMVKVHIQHLRKKLNEDLLNPRLIITERGRGYRFIGNH